MFDSEEGDKGHREGKDSVIESEDEGQISIGIGHIIATFLATLIGSILGFYMSQK